MSAFSTSGTITMNGKEPISSKNGDEDQSSQATNMVYRLDGLICHYGYTHSSGHFVAYRRKPEPDVRSLADSVLHPRGRWLRISDADVDEVPESAVLGERSNAFLLFYERLPSDAPLDKRDALAFNRSSNASTDMDASQPESILDALKRQKDGPEPVSSVSTNTDAIAITEKSIDSLE